MTDPLTALLIATPITAVGLMLFWPESGIFWRWKQTRGMTERVMREDALKHIFNCATRGEPATMASIAGALHITADAATQLLLGMAEREFVEVNGDQLELCDKGRDCALHVIRAHRLWERHLADETGLAESEWHSRADRAEHRLSPEDTDAIENRLNYPAFDPHGDPIPTASGEISEPVGSPLTSLTPGEAATIVHLEDEPEAVFAQIAAEGLYPGMNIRLLDISRHRVRFWSDGDEHVLAPIVAVNITVVPIPREQDVDVGRTTPLSSLDVGAKARVASLSGACRGLDRRRFMDLGILPGTVVEATMVSPSGDPTAYRIRGALIALRRDQADLIRVTEEEVNG